MKIRLTEKRLRILNYLREHPGEWFSPIQIGRTVGEKSNDQYREKWCKPTLELFTSLGLIEKSYRGPRGGVRYRVTVVNLISTLQELSL